MSKINRVISEGVQWRISNRRRELHVSVDYELIPGYRNNNPLLYLIEEQQFYKRQSATSDCVNYTCYVTGCRCKMSIRGGICYVGSEFHDHMNQAGMYIDLCALNKMKRIMRREDNQLTPRTVFKKVKRRYVWLSEFRFLACVNECFVGSENDESK